MQVTINFAANCFVGVKLCYSTMATLRCVDVSSLAWEFWVILNLSRLRNSLSK